MGIFVRKLGTYGFGSIQIVSIRVTLAALIGMLVFSEPLTWMSGTGILLILSAVVMLNLGDA